MSEIFDTNEQETIETTFSVTNSAKIAGGWASSGKLTFPGGVSIVASYPPGWEIEDAVIDSRQQSADAISALEAAKRAEEIAQNMLTPWLVNQVVSTRSIELFGSVVVVE